MERIGESSVLLPNYSCNGRDELDPFRPAFRQNENETSLQIKLYKSDELVIYKNVEYYKLNGEVQTDFSNAFLGNVVEALKKIEAIPEGLPPHVALAHEMYHAFDSIRGILDMRFVQGEKYEFAFISEYRAVYFENIARKAAGIDYRTHYDQDQTGPGVLDEYGEPRKMPSPCL